MIRELAFTVPLYTPKATRAIHINLKEKTTTTAFLNRTRTVRDPATSHALVPTCRRVNRKTATEVGVGTGQTATAT